MSTRLLVVFAIAAFALWIPPRVRGSVASMLDLPAHTRTLVIRYRAHTGRTRSHTSWCRSHTSLAARRCYRSLFRLTGAAHLDARTRGRGDLPAPGSFAVVNPDGEGDRFGAYSGAPGQIDDLARMPEVIAHALPWLTIDRRRIYARRQHGRPGDAASSRASSSLARGRGSIRLLTPRISGLSPIPRLACTAACRGRLGTTLGSELQRLARMEVGGDLVAAAPALCSARSPLRMHARRARACVPLQIWWSRSDRIVVDPDRQSGRLLAELRRWNPLAPIEGVEGVLGTYRRNARERTSALCAC